MEELKKAKHYNTYDIETIDIMEKVFGVEKLIIWCTITAFKYRMRMGKKDSVNDDLFKENWYLEKAKELKESCINELKNEETISFDDFIKENGFTRKIEYTYLDADGNKWLEEDIKTLMREDY
jgi:hypothetical protein